MNWRVSGRRSEGLVKFPPQLLLSLLRFDTILEVYRRNHTIINAFKKLHQLCVYGHEGLEPVRCEARKVHLVSPSQVVPDDEYHLVEI